jgi:hypothetical protein
MLSVNSNVKLEMESVKRSQDLSFVREETQEKIGVVNRKFNSCVFESLELQMSEINKAVQKYLRNYITKRKK